MRHDLAGPLGAVGTSETHLHRSPMRNLKIALFSLVVAASACKKDKDKAAEPAKSADDTAKPAGDTATPTGDTAKPEDKPAEPAAGGGSGDACADLKAKLCE